MASGSLICGSHRSSSMTSSRISASDFTGSPQSARPSCPPIPGCAGRRRPTSHVRLDSAVAESFPRRLAGPGTPAASPARLVPGGGLHGLVMWRGRRCGIVVPMTQVNRRVRTSDRPSADGLGQSAIILNRRAVPSEVAFWLIGYVFAALVLGTALPAPLYAIYQRQWHFSSGVLTLIYAVYAVAVLATLLLAGRASDQAGRKPVMAAALGFAVASTVVFILASSPGWLYPARVLSGVSAGLMIGTATAALTEMVRESATRRASLVAASVSTGAAALGPLMAGLFAQFLPRPTV